MEIRINEELHSLIVDTINTGLYNDVEKIEKEDESVKSYIANTTNQYDIRQVLNFIKESIEFRNKGSLNYKNK